MPAMDLALSRDTGAGQVPLVVLRELGHHDLESAAVPCLDLSREHLELAPLVHRGESTSRGCAILGRPLSP
jgi:hypothetical protein